MNWHDLEIMLFEESLVRKDGGLFIVGRLR